MREEETGDFDFFFFFGQLRLQSKTLSQKEEKGRESEKGRRNCFHRDLEKLSRAEIVLHK